MRWFLLAVAAPSLLACSSSDEATATPLPPPSLTIESVTPAGGVAWLPGGTCVARGSDALATVALRVGPHPTLGDGTSLDVAALANWALRPRWDCGGASHCGYVRVDVDPGATSALLGVEACSTAIEVPLVDVPDGSHVFRATLRHEDGSDYIGPDHLPVQSEVSIELSAPGTCP